MYQDLNKMNYNDERKSVEWAAQWLLAHKVNIYKINLQV